MSDIKETAETPKPARADLDMAKIQSAMQGEKERQAKELQEDLEKFNNRPRPPWAEAPTAGPQPDVTPPPEETLLSDRPEQVTAVPEPPTAVVSSADEAAAEPNVANPPLEHRPKSAVGDLGDAERAESGAEKVEKEQFMGYGRGLERGG